MSGPYYDWSTQDAWATGAWLPDTWLAGAYGTDVWLPASGGGAAYVAKAVECTNFGGLQQIGTAVADSNVCSGAIWVNYSSDSLDFGSWTFLSSKNGTDFGGAGAFEFYNFQHVATDIAFSAQASDGTTSATASSAPGTITFDTWYPILWSYNSTDGTTNLYIGDTNVFAAYDVGPIVPTPMPFNGNDFILGLDPRQNGPSSGMRFSNCWISTTQFVDWSNVANRRKILDASGKPVDPGDGSLLTGRKPEMFFTGDASTFGTNLGICGAFITNGTLTNATTSPSD